MSQSSLIWTITPTLMILLNLIKDDVAVLTHLDHHSDLKQLKNKAITKNVAVLTHLDHHSDMETSNFKHTFSVAVLTHLDHHSDKLNKAV